jgi:DNA invertase Pin-like site-specific DNA recombinase
MVKTKPKKKRKPVKGKKAKPPKTVAYLRVSTIDQDLEKNKADILKLANDKNFGKVEFIEEKASGYKTGWKDRKVKKIIDDLEKGDRLIVPEMSRLGRSMLDILQLLSICKEKGIDVHAVKGNWSLNGTIESKIVMTIYAMAAEIERDLISQRTKEGLRAARAKGKILGRPKGPGKSKLDKFRPEIEALLKDGSPKTFIAKRYGTTPANLHNWLKKNKIDAKPDVELVT